MSPLRMLAALAEAPVRVRAVSDRVDRLGTSGFVAALDQLARDAARGANPADTDAMLACALWLLTDPGGEEFVGELLFAARDGKHEIAISLLDDGNEPAHKALAPKGRLADHGGPNRIIRQYAVWNPSTRAVAATIAQYKEAATEPWLIDAYERWEERILAQSDAYPGDEGYWATGPLPASHVARQIEHLARRPDAESIARVLRDRATKEKHVIRLAARRPTTPAIVDQLLHYPEWMSRLDVRTAVVENPFTPLRAALLLLPTCRASLGNIAKTKADVHPRLVASARVLSGR